MTSWVAEPDHSVAQDIVFVGDGFTQEQLSTFATVVDVFKAALEGAASGRAIVPLAPSLFNFHRVDVASTTSDVSDEDTTDSALGSVAIGTEPIRYDSAAALFAGAVNAPDVDTLIVIVNATAGRANAVLPSQHTRGGRAVLRRDDPAATLEHELGHALFGLADEYSVYSGCFAGAEGSLVRFANLTTGGTGEKFSRAGAVTPVEGAHWWGQCVFRPADTCLMRSTAADWCPVCLRHVQTQLTERTAGDSDAPYAGFEFPRDGALVRGTVTVEGRAFDSFGTTRLELRIGSVLRANADGAVLSYPWSTQRELNGPHTLELKAFDAHGHVEVTSVRVSVDNPPDLTPPSVLLPEPSAETLSGWVHLRTTASDDVGVVSTELWLDGERLASISELDWDSRTVADGAHVLEARAWDYAGNMGSSGPKQVLVRNDWEGPRVQLLSPESGSVLSGRVRLKLETVDTHAVVSSALLLDGAHLGGGPELDWDTTRVPNGAYTLAAVAEDAWGNQGTSAAVHVEVRNTDSCGGCSAAGEAAPALLLALGLLSRRRCVRSQGGRAGAASGSTGRRARRAKGCA